MNLSLKISLLTSVVSIFFMMLVFTNTQHNIIRQSKQHVIQDYQDDINQLKGSMDLILKKYTDVANLSSLITEDNCKKTEILKKKFNKSMKDIKKINMMKFITLQGKESVIVSRNRLFEKVNPDISYNRTDLFKEALKGKIYYSDIYFTKENNEMMIDISKNVTDIKSNKTLGVLILQISLDDIQEKISNKLINGNGIALFDLNNRKFLYKSSTTNQIDREKLITGFDTSNVKYITQSDVEYILISNDYDFDRLNFKIIILNSANNIFKHIEKTFNLNILFLTVAVLLLAVIIFTFIKYNLDPLYELKEEIEELSDKLRPQEEHLKNKNDSDEILAIKENFHLFTMLIEKEREKLKIYNENLKLKIEEEVRKNKEKEQALAQNAKLVSMGEMIGNIAHQWRQPLSIISTSASGMDVKADFDNLTKEEIKDFSQKIIQQTQYLSNTIDDFRSFIKGDMRYLPLNIKEAIKETLGLINATLKNNYIDLIEDTKDDIKIYGNKNELTQAFINIINNAKDAMKNTEHEKLLFLSTKKINDDTLELKILDSGGGIPEDIINRIFEPYFTTKHKSVGTGIGLSMVDQIIRERHKASISVTNEEYVYNDKQYKGACFKIIFKAQQKSA